MLRPAVGAHLVRVRQRVDPAVADRLDKFVAAFDLQDCSRDLLTRALTHSFNNHNLSSRRLAMLGDSLVDVWTHSYLLSRYPLLSAESTHNKKLKIVSDKNFAYLFRNHFGLEGCVIMSDQGHEQGRHFVGTNVEATCAEAIIGAVFMDKGFEKASDFAEHHVMPTLLAKAKEVHDGEEDPVAIATSRIKNLLNVTPRFSLVPAVEPGKITAGLYLDFQLVHTATSTTMERAVAEICIHLNCLSEGDFRKFLLGTPNHPKTELVEKMRTPYSRSRADVQNLKMSIFKRQRRSEPQCSTAQRWQHRRQSVEERFRERSSEKRDRQRGGVY